MTAAALTLELAAIAHRLWCDRMRADGWRYGAGYDPERRTHDALVAFDQLGVEDRRAACMAIEALELEVRLAAALRYDRGSDRELRAAELRAGLRVELADAPADSGGGQGTILDWEVDRESGVLRRVRVRWASGEVSEHFPSERELRRVGAWG